MRKSHSKIVCIKLVHLPYLQLMLFALYDLKVQCMNIVIFGILAVNSEYFGIDFEYCEVT